MLVVVSLVLMPAIAFISLVMALVNWENPIKLFKELDSDFIGFNSFVKEAIPYIKGDL